MALQEKEMAALKFISALVNLTLKGQISAFGHIFLADFVVSGGLTNPWSPGTVFWCLLQ